MAERGKRTHQPAPPSRGAGLPRRRRVFVPPPANDNITARQRYLLGLAAATLIAAFMVLFWE